MFNADSKPASFVLPDRAGAGPWRLAIDTAQPTIPDLDAPVAGLKAVKGPLYAVGSRSGAVLVAEATGDPSARRASRAPRAG
jgi:hypothetical protein